MDKGRRLGLDYGSARVGVAISDPDGILATPYVTLKANEVLIDEIKKICNLETIVLIVIGFPRSLNGEVGHAGNLVANFILHLETQIPNTPVVTFDERFTTTLASQALRASGKNVKEGRAIIDQIAAVNILQDFLDSHRD